MKHRFHVLVLMERYDHAMRVGIGRLAAEQGWILTVDDGCMLPRGWSGDGILTMLGARQDIVQYVRRQRMPRVDIGDNRPDIALPRVCGDHRLIGQVGADHLADRGYTRAVYFSTARGRQPSLRGDGFGERFAMRTGCPPKAWVWADEAQRAVDDSRALNRWLKRKLRAETKPLAVFCYEDGDAGKVLAAALEAGFAIPAEVAILGVDNDVLICENARVPLSSVRHDRVRVGYDGAVLLDRLMRGGQAPEQPILVPPCGVELRASTDAFSADDALVRQAIGYVRSHLASSIGIADVAKAVGLSPRKLEAHFNQAAGESVHSLLTRLRVFEARKRLSLTDLPVKAIARETGFCHGPHLNNVFKRHEGMTPLAFRELERRRRGS
jgi:LacI family transcriptional regulator